MDFQNYNELFNALNYPRFRTCNFKDGFLKKGYSILPEDDSPCLCLSGNIFKDCCKNRFVSTYKKYLDNNQWPSREEIYGSNERKYLSRKTEEKSIKKKNISYCFASGLCGSCDSLNVHSHTMSKGNVLKNLSDNDKVIKFDNHKMIDDISIDSINDFFDDIPISVASATVSFCKSHDKMLFGEIEKDGHKNYQGSCIENLEYALKAISFDIYFAIMQIKYLSELFVKDISCAGDMFLADYAKDINELFALYSPAQRLLNDIRDYKEKGKQAFDLKTLAIKLPVKKINYSLSECIFLENTLCFLNVANIPDPYIIVSYYDNKKISCIEKIRNNLDIGSLEYYEDILDLTLGTTRNVYFNKKVFCSLSPSAKMILLFMHRSYDIIRCGPMKKIHSILQNIQSSEIRNELVAKLFLKG